MAYTSVNPYVTVEALAAEIKRDVPEAESAEEDLLKAAIDRASRWVDDYTQRDYFEHDHTTTPLILNQFSEGVYNDRIFLPYSPVIELTQVDIGSDTVLEDEDFAVGVRENDGILFCLAGDWSPLHPDRLITIYGRFGYDQAGNSTAVPANLPGKITSATLLVAAVFSNMKTVELRGLDETVEEIAVNEIPKAVYQILGRRGKILV